MKTTKTVFVAMSADIFHTGHLNIIKVARELGDVIVGLGTDEVSARYKQMALMSYDERRAILENIKGVVRVIPQPSLDLVPNLKALKPDYVVHGDDWKTGFLRKTRQDVIEALKEWNGQLVEPPYTPGISSTKLRSAVQTANSSPHAGSYQLQRLLQLKPFVRFVAIHDALSASICQDAQLTRGNRNHPLEFDALWLDHQAETVVRGRTSAELLEFSSRMPTIQDILHVARKPLVVTLSHELSAAQFSDQVAQLERIGAAGVAVMLPPEKSNAYICQARETINNRLFAIIHDFGTLTPQTSLDLLYQSTQTALKAGTDALLLTTTIETEAMFQDFMRKYSAQNGRLPIIVQPQEYVGNENAFAGAQAVVIRNQILRKTIQAVEETAVSILKQSASAEITHFERQ